MRTRIFSIAAGAVLLAACAEIPNGPSVAVMPPPGKPFDLFVADDQLCRWFGGWNRSCDRRSRWNGRGPGPGRQFPRRHAAPLRHRVSAVHVRARQPAAGPVGRWLSLVYAAATPVRCGANAAARGAAASARGAAATPAGGALNVPRIAPNPDRRSISPRQMVLVRAILGTPVAPVCARHRRSSRSSRRN
jgi:hypothetical protein